jgi:hypothetical protein
MYQIADTAFSTLTVNMNFRTAMHRDAGDFQEGFGNLSVIEWGRYQGGETLFPQYGVGINLRTGDFVAMDVHQWHCNSGIHQTAADKAFNESLPDIRTRDSTTGVVGSQERFQRISFVCYFREKIANCSEQATRDYYQKINFNLKDETAKAKQGSLPSLPIPGITGTLEEARAAFAKVRSKRTRKATEKKDKSKDKSKTRKRQH